MKNARLMNRAEDFKKMGVKPGVVESWEDGKRDDDKTGKFEWWYFDAIMDDGTKVVVNFNTKLHHAGYEEGSPRFLRVRITPPDEKSHYEEFFTVAVNETHIGKDSCSVRYGPHSFSGNLREYSIKVVPVNGIGVDLKLESLSKSWRPGTSHFVFGEQEEKYFTWLCAVPKGRVTGEVTYGGRTAKVQGYGYHDHQWANVEHVYVWNHWLWARQNFGDYNMLVFDFVTAKEYGFKRFPLCFIQDSDGRIVFESTESVKSDVLDEYVQESTKKHYPKVSKYFFENGGKTVQYTLAADSEIEVMDVYGNAPLPLKERYDRLNVQPSYARYSATGELVFFDGNQSVERSGQLLYEFAYLGKTYRGFS